MDNNSDLKCYAVEENPDSIKKERDNYREENRKLLSDNNDLKNLIIKILFDRYGF